MLKFRSIYIIPILISLITITMFDAHSKKIKQSLKVTQQKHPKNNENSNEEPIESIVLTPDTKAVFVDSIGNHIDLSWEMIKFAGYHKDANDSKESFLINNSSPLTLAGFKAKLIYLDMKDRMLHSRLLTENVFIPSGETRKIDIPTWDPQHAYFYYLGNEPRKVATPYKVKIIPVSCNLIY